MRRSTVWAATVVGVAAIGWHLRVAPWQRRWGASDVEVAMALPGDDLVAEPAEQITRAITIDAEPEAVWPWIVQIGADRGGFYSYAWLENLFGLGIHNSDVVVPAWQHREVGDLVFADSKGSGGWYVMDVQPDHALVLLVGDVRSGRPLRRDEQLRWEFCWSFVLLPLPRRRCRLLVRERTGFGHPLTRAMMSPIGVVSFVMTREMLRGIKRRVEAVAPDQGAPVES